MGYQSKYGESCVCPYCGKTQNVDVDLDSSTWDEEVDCDDCGGAFKYDLEVTIEFSCHPIDGEGPHGEDGEVIAPKFNDPNQISIFESENLSG